MRPSARHAACAPLLTCFRRLALGASLTALEQASVLARSRLCKRARAYTDASLVDALSLAQRYCTHAVHARCSCITWRATCNLAHNTTMCAPQLACYRRSALGASSTASEQARVSLAQRYCPHAVHARCSCITRRAARDLAHDKTACAPLLACFKRSALGASLKQARMYWRSRLSQRARA